MAGAVLVALILGVFAYVILETQSQDREDVERRFRDVAQVSAAVTDGIFGISLSGNQRQAANRFGRPQVGQASLQSLASQSQLAYAVVLDEDGERLAATADAPPAAGKSAAVERTVETGQPHISDVLGDGRDGVVELVVPFPSGSGQRIYVNGTRLSRFAQFLSGFLGSVPNFAQAESVMIDSRGTVLGGSNLSTGIGEPLEDEELRAVALAEEAGDYGDGRYFASAPISGSPFQVVLDADKDDLYDSIAGSRGSVPWILFAAFALAALGGLYLLRAAILARAQLQRRQLNERHAVDINDNIIQGLALAKYQLEAGAVEAGAAQLADTLHEAQTLVSELLGEADVEAGQLRRGAAADVKREP